jgi:hypothetical protein
VEIKQAGEILIAINVINHSIKKIVKENLLTVNAIQQTSRYGHRKKPSILNKLE